MIAFLRGVISEKTPTRIVLDVGGVGYEVMIPVSTFEKLGKIGSEQKLLTHQHVREDALLLFGFHDPLEKSVFLDLISVSGVGPKLALGVLSGCPVDVLRQAIVAEDIARLIRLPGIGKKTAQRLVIELKEKIVKRAGEAGVALLHSGEEEPKESVEAVLAMVSLGYPKSHAEQMVAKLLNKEPDITLDELIKKALQNL